MIPYNGTCIQPSTASICLTAFCFGILVAWSSYIFALAIVLLQKNGSKAIYILNVLQAVLILLKISAAAVYSIGDDLYCYPRSWLTSIPVAVANELVYVILLLTLLVMTPFKKLCIAIFAIVLSSHFAITAAGVAIAIRAIDSSARCTDTYNGFYKQQYTLEAFLEVFTLIMLLHALNAMVGHGSTILAKTESILNEFKSNAELRVYLVLIVIGMKIVHTWAFNGGFMIGIYNSITFTHALDLARSHICCWALERVKRRLQMKAKRPSTTGFLRPMAGVEIAADFSPSPQTIDSVRA
ncbi:hypothetical protein SmJEL517_g04505 [Synchytrium microbalum]|uniref:Uncharacterized protein n=1 Tax=Synchytrium microbalum TaxID=1806994 RepID=A0A507C300_9FUNG|nr:uncharacterized protein SmJEL517_g04505 [Synchytrium microbalum]TPX32326.1 hypothetical protein SmJEL517_g04505 [Synchytrium microbalum]